MASVLYTSGSLPRAADSHTVAISGQRGRFIPFPCPAAVSYLPFVLGGIVAMSALIFLLCFIFVESTGALPVVDLTWKRTIDIERNTLCTEEGWYVPQDGTVIDSWAAIYDYDTIVISHPDSNGEGGVSITVPDYETRYRYTLWRWLWNRTATAEGGGSIQPGWPTPQLEASVERLGRREEEYRVWCKDANGKLISTKAPYKNYMALEKGNTVLGVFNVFGHLRRVELLESAE